MHFLTLVPVTVPEQEPDPIKDVLVQATLMELREKMESDPKDFMAKIFASELTGKTTPFGRAVFDAVYEKLDPYAVETENPACREFTDCTDEIREEYRNGTIDCVRLADGTVVERFDPRFRNRFDIRDACLDAFTTTFDAFTPMLNFHEQQDAQTEWRSCRVSSLTVAPLDASSPLSYSSFAGKCSQEAVDDTKTGLGLAMGLYDGYYPIRDTAYKSLLDRAKISGSALAKLSRPVLASVLNECLQLYSSDALLLLREGKVSAVHSGDAVDYSVLPISELLGTLKTKLDGRFPGNVFLAGYTDHAITSASWQLPDQQEDLLGTYAKLLAASGRATMAGKLTPGIRFITSDTGVASAKVSALLTGGQHPIHIGSCVAVDHRHQSKIVYFESAMDQLFAQFGDAVAKLQALMEIHLDYPVNAMTRVCKKLSMPKKAADEAIAMFEMAYGDNPATAHDVFMAMQEIPYILKTEHTPESKLLIVEENMARAMSLGWSEYDRARAVS